MGVEDLILVALGLLISLYGSIVGFGGGIFMVPILVAVFGFDMDIAAGSVMLALVPSSLISTMLNKKKGQVDFKVGMLLEVPTMIGVVVGGFILTYLTLSGNLRILELGFTLMVVTLGLTFFVKRKSKNAQRQGILYRLNKTKPVIIIKNSGHHVAYRVSMVLALFFGLVSGVLAGLFGVGGGFLKTPIMIKVFEIPAKIATATALFMIVITSIVGSTMHSLHGHVVWAQTWPVVVGFSLGAVGSHFINMQIKKSFLEKLIGFSLLAVACMLVLKFLFHIG